METLAKLLRTRDWYYNYSDDYTVWCRGRDQSALITAEINRLLGEGISQSEINQVWNDYAPSDMKKKV